MTSDIAGIDVIGGEAAAPVPLSTPLKVILGFLGAGSAALGVMAFVGMFSAVKRYASRFVGTDAWMVPVGTDLGILLMSGFGIWLELAQRHTPKDKRLNLLPLRAAIWLMIGLQLGINLSAANGDPHGMLVHAVLPVLFVTILELWQFIIRWRSGLVSGVKGKRDKIPVARYLHDWSGSRDTKKAMILWNQPSYEVALDMLQDKQLAETSLAIMYPDGGAPEDLVLKLKLPKYIAEACADIERQRKKFDAGPAAKPKPAGERSGPPGTPAPAPSPKGPETAPRTDCCQAHKALDRKSTLPMEKPLGNGAVDPIGNAFSVHAEFVRVHGRSMGRDFIGSVFGVGSANAAKVRDDIKARAQSGGRSGPESGPQSGGESGQPAPGESGPGAGLVNGAPAGSGAR